MCFSGLLSPAYLFSLTKTKFKKPLKILNEAAPFLFFEQVLAQPFDIEFQKKSRPRISINFIIIGCLFKNIHAQGQNQIPKSTFGQLLLPDHTKNIEKENSLRPICAR